ncbi:hypothetical protein HYPSUDRAFT_178187 [Hypholoma sublateritium FD-334 SS-4]|uniref:CID domain-containing protein n=1 Tax=Hypholoma sublateritium (strain FD-334 SS-4) TaxID=945553 RepID=A0A0D2MVN5_HYPSF|nr:hypothetical protein HYPSUDRAFT_178187 [Hypholoma sublateritium FD-334 SS-4]
MSVSDFESVLREVVNGKRLSASKMMNLTDIAMKNMENDTKLVSILYRTHKSLPNTAAKIYSLYVFDALSRAAKHHATKHNLSGDAFSNPGNAATFLLKVGGVVEGLFQDLVTGGTPESKEKTKKILDIWIKGSTFPPTILVPLADILSGNKKEPDAPVSVVPVTEPQPTPTVDPRMAHTIHTPVSAPITPSVVVVDQHATLLALLTQAAASTTVPTHAPINTIISPPPLDAAQLAVIQQLAHTAASVPSVPQFLPPPDLVNVQKFPSSSGVNGSSHSLPSYRNEPRNAVNSEHSPIGYRSPESEARPDSHFDERDNMRGRYKPGLRNRGRGERSGRNWDPRDRDYYKTGRDQSPSTRAGRGDRSRSRSPGPSSRYSARRNSRYSSPPRKAPGNEPGKDEFGRDIRPEIPHSPAANHRSPSPTLKAPSEQSKDSRSPLASTTDHNSTPESNSVSTFVPVIANISSTKPSAASLVTNTNDPGMESFDSSTFDFTSPTEWEALGKMWQVTNGYLPSTEELMHFMMTSGTAQATSNSGIATQDSQMNAPTAGRGYPRSGGRGRGGFTGGRGGAYGMPSDGSSNYTDHQRSTDAIVLQELAQDDEKYASFSGGQVWNQKIEHEESTSNAGGRMQRVGDKWVFVRGTAMMDVS